ncbi:MAG: DUF374 domain-containing protein [Elusimicrobiota bacterium]|nr:MAG: DUF374 domain-containing protein [Elusimicrobiota bacterium]
MRKIKGFKLTLRPHVVKQRSKKAKLDLEGAGLNELALGKFLERTAKTLTPGVVFETFGAPDADQTLLSPMPGLAYSLILASLGEGFGPARAKETEIPEALWPILEEHALDEAVRFASTLLADEAEKDNCELSPLNPLSEAAALEAAVRKLDAQNKLSVTLVDGRLSPPPPSRSASPGSRSRRRSGSSAPQARPLPRLLLRHLRRLDHASARHPRRYSVECARQGRALHLRVLAPAPGVLHLVPPRRPCRGPRQQVERRRDDRRDDAAVRDQRGARLLLRGGAAAAREMVDILKSGWDAGITPDGPKGPARQVKEGAVRVAQLAGTAIVPIANALSHRIEIAKAWDRFQVPLPFGRSVVIYGEPLYVREGDDLAAKAAELKAALDRLTDEADRLVA